MLASTETDQCVIVDPLLDIETVLSETRTLGFDRITHVIDTHTHADHISGARNIAKTSGLADVYMHMNSGSSFKTIPVQDGDVMRLGSTTLQFVHTPGHTHDHVCILVNDSKLLTGDTLLIGDVGRIDLGGDQRKNSDMLYESLHNKLLKLDDNVEVFPTHIGAAHHIESTSKSSTLGREKAGNPALRLKNKDEFFKYMTEGWPPKPPDYQNIIRLNRGQISIPMT
jgi:glyoxylase-like metal-dependent hydrolase (beta-lactamase superfamily II)